MSGFIRSSVQRLINTVANCTEFQKWVGEPSNADAAASRIHKTSLPRPAGDVYTLEEIQLLRPFAIVSPNQNQGFGMRRTAAPSTWQSRANLLIHFEQETPESMKWDDSGIAWEIYETAGRILGRPEDEADLTFVGLRNLLNVSSSNDYLVADDVDMLGPFRSDRKTWATEGDFVYWMFIVQMFSPA